jgi:hypothetical protein
VREHKALHSLGGDANTKAAKGVIGVDLVTGLGSFRVRSSAAWTRRASLVTNSQNRHFSPRTKSPRTRCTNHAPK